MANMFKAVLSAPSVDPGKGLDLTVVCDEVFAGLSISCSKPEANSFIQTCPSSSPYEVVFRIPESGTWTISTVYNDNTYSTTINADLDMETNLYYGFSWQNWVTSGGLDPTDYTDLNDLLEDEEAIRRLCLVHNSVDYLCNTIVVNSDLEKVIRADLFAKWVNNSDYALDNMLANEVIKEAMDKSIPTAVGQVPTMTSNTAPSGTVIYSAEYNSSYQAFQAFDGNDSTLWIAGNSATNNYIGYTFTNPIIPCKVKAIVLCGPSSGYTCPARTFTIQGSNDGFTSDIHDLGTFSTTATSSSTTVEFNVDITSNTSYSSLRLFCADTLIIANNWGVDIKTLQFYAYEYSSKYGYGEWALMPQVPKMTSNTAPYGEAFASSIYSSDYPVWKAFDGDDSSVWNASNGTSAWIAYRFNNPICPKRVVAVLPGVAKLGTYKIQGSNDGFVNDVDDLTDVLTMSSVNIDEEITTNKTYLYLRFYQLSITGGSTSIALSSLQFYAWAPKGNVPVMTSNTAPYGSVFATSANSNYPAYNAFDGGNVSGSYLTLWQASSTSYPQIIGYQFVNPVCVKRVMLSTLVNGTTPLIGSFKIVAKNASNDEWTTLYSGTLTNYTQRDIPRYFDIDNDNYYLYYALSILDANGNMATVSSLQFYGRELSVSVPKMATNTTPYGTVSADTYVNENFAPWKAFDGDALVSGSTQKTYWGVNDANSGHWLRYQFISPTKVNRVYVEILRSLQFKIQGSNDGFSSDIHDLTDELSITTAGVEKGQYFDIENNDTYSYYRLYTLGADTYTYVTELQFYGFDYSEREFESGVTKKWLYDHGVELETLDIVTTSSSCLVEKENSQVHTYVPATTNVIASLYALVDTTSYNVMRAKIGDKLYCSTSGNAGGWMGISSTTPTASTSWTSEINITPSSELKPNEQGIDVSSITGNNYVSIHSRNGGGNYIREATFKELWLE